MTHHIQVATRKTGHADLVRGQGQMPGVVYGPDMKSVSIALDFRAFERLYKTVGTSTLFECQIDDKSDGSMVLIQDVQYDPVHRRPIHVDFRQINMNEEMETAIPLVFIGEAPAVREGGGTLVTSLEEVEVRCLPKDLVNHIEVDLSVLKTFQNSIHIKDIIVPSGITIVSSADSIVANVMVPLTDDQIKAMEDQGPKSVEDVEVTAKKKEDAEAAGEGEESDTAKKGDTAKKKE